ncbi:MAG TPA: membrane dipeptidase [Vineibacter sp.]|nr:membrane dipeptidase [Vineibacter sp.]
MPSPRRFGPTRRRIALAAVSAVVALVFLTAGCGPVADLVDGRLNRTAEPPERMPGPAAQAVHNRLMVADLHADTLLWRRGISAAEVARGHVDLPRLRRGNIGLQAFTIATRVPSSRGGCIAGDNFDPASLLATINGWPTATHDSAYQRALHQADRLNDAAAANASGPAVQLRVIRSDQNLRAWRAARFPSPGVVDASVVAVVLGLEGSHALNDTVGAELDELYRRGLRMIAPTHRFDNAFGRSSEGCGVAGSDSQQRGLTELGRQLIRGAIDRRMIVDVSHSSTQAVMDSATIAGPARHPLLVSHGGLRSFLVAQPACCQGHANRASVDDELIAIAQTGGVFGMGFWKAVIGTDDVEHIVAAIRHALAVLQPHVGQPPRAPGFHTIRRASQHVGLGSDWDGAVRTAIHAGQVGLITEGLLAAGVPEQQIADIMGLNVCRVFAQSLGRTTFDEALRLCGG